MKILIVKTSSIGDVLHTFPVLAYLRRRFPSAEIDWAVEKESASLLRAHPKLDEIVVLDTRSWRKTLLAKKTRQEIGDFLRALRRKKYDLLIDLQGNSKSALVTCAARAKEKVGFAWRALSEKPNWFVTTRRYAPPVHLSVRERNLHLVQRHFGDFSKEEISSIHLRLSSEEVARKEKILSALQGAGLMICFGSKWKNKQLSEETLFLLLQKIEEKYKPALLFIWGNAAEKQRADHLQRSFKNSHSIGGLTLNLWQALMAEMRGVLAVDSAALHLCATTNTPSFSIFGASSSRFYKPDGERHVAVQGACPYGQLFEKRCPILRTCATGACIRSLSANDLFAAFEQWWQRNSKQS